MAEISILVPIYNVGKYLRACLDSILAQTFTDFEVICMDDGSTDNSGAILDEYALFDKRIKVFHKENSGYGKTMNAALRLAEGKYIGIVESDDTIEKSMYQILYDKVVNDNLDIVKSDFYLVWDNEDRAVRKQYFSLADRHEMYNRVINPNVELESYLVQKFTWNALYKKELIQRNNIRYNETSGASYQVNGFWFQTFYWASRVMFLDKPFYNYRQDNMDASSHSRQKVYAMKNEFDFIRNFMVSHDDKRDDLYKICFHLRMRAYLFTLGRIDISLKPAFAKTIASECCFFEKQGEACYKWLTEEQVEIVKNPVDYVEDVLIGYKEITREVISGYKNIVVYGAGVHGEKVVYRVKEAKAEHQTVKVAVTNLNGRSVICQGENVCELSSCVHDKDSTLAILAVKENSDAFHRSEEHTSELQSQR